MPDQYPLFIPLAPLIAALISALPQSYFGAKNFKLSRLIMLAGFASSLVLLWQSIQSAEAIRLVLFDLSWQVLPLVELSLDRLSAVMMVVISGFGALLYHYSTRYLQQDAGQSRYQTLLALAVSSLLFMVSSADLVTLFVFWQVLSWFLCLLSHNFAHIPTAHSSFRTFIMLRFGDLAFLTGIVLSYKLYGTIQFSELFERAALDHTSFSIFGSDWEIAATTLITLLIFIGAMSKSAQFPLHMWLPDSLYAPTPIHALLHAGIINAGGFLLNRLAPLYALSSTTLHAVLVIGLATAILGTSMMLVQNDIKKTLGYSTIGQMGYMIMECGLGAFSLAVFHLIAHGLFKADIFLNCGKGIQEARQHPAEVESSSESGRSASEWIGAFILSFLIPLLIIIGVHYVLGISFMEHQGLLVLLLFSWITASQAALTLFRLKSTFLTKAGMLVAVGIVATAYFFAAEQFDHFLNPDPRVTAGYFEAAELPYNLFQLLTAVLVLSIAAAWFCALSSKEKDNESWLGKLKLNLYLFFMNRLYLDGLTLRLNNGLKRLGRKIDQSVIVFIVFSALSLVIAFREQDTLSILAVLAIAGALWGSIKALVQVRVPQLLFYGGLAQYSILLWHFAQAGKMNANLISFASSLTLVWIGLIFAWSRISARYGNLNLNQIGGLFQTMPRFSLCLGLLIMAAVGLAPFSLFFGYIGILLSPSLTISYGLILTIVTWFIACWYLFKLMQRLLFGPYRNDLRYEDLSPTEIFIFLIIIGLLVLPNDVTQAWLMEVIR